MTILFSTEFFHLLFPRNTLIYTKVQTYSVGRSFKSYIIEYKDIIELDDLKSQPVRIVWTIGLEGRVNLKILISSLFVEEITGVNWNNWYYVCYPFFPWRIHKFTIVIIWFNYGIWSRYRVTNSSLCFSLSFSLEIIYPLAILGFESKKLMKNQWYLSEHV